MISFTQNLESFFMPRVSVMNILCLNHAFKDSPLSADTWVQHTDNKISAVLSRFGNRLYLYSNQEGIDELKEFINFLNCSEVFCEEEVARKLNLKINKTFNVLHKYSSKLREFDYNSVSLKNLYQNLSFGADGDIVLPSFEDFAADVSHRLRHGGGVALTSKQGAALAFVCKNGGIINGISVYRSSRGKGIGSKLLNNLCEFINNNVFVCCSDENTEFYIKNGFALIDKAVIAGGPDATVL